MDRAEHGGNLISLPPCHQKRATLIHLRLSIFQKENGGFDFNPQKPPFDLNALPEQRFCNRCCECQQSHIKKEPTTVILLTVIGSASLRLAL